MAEIACRPAQGLRRGGRGKGTSVKPHDPLLKALARTLPALVFLFSSACGGGVQAYQRGRLAQPKMQIGQDPEATALEQHVYEYREGASGGYGTMGGGCGCN